MNKLIIWCAAAAFGLSALAETFTLKDGVSGSFDWTLGSNYVGDGTPGANLSRWQVKVGGKVGRWSVRVADGKLCFAPSGMLLLVR